mmetsp:Transcript_16201/g.63176  ORF Transcript_16201/g.63176 Transcript_16201/m.63176 type:complete len:200 (-) Transcript_16201:1327-1926(-)
MPLLFQLARQQRQGVAALHEGAAEELGSGGAVLWVLFGEPEDYARGLGVLPGEGRGQRSSVTQSVDHLGALHAREEGMVELEKDDPEAINVGLLIINVLPQLLWTCVTDRANAGGTREAGRCYGAGVLVHEADARRRRHNHQRGRALAADCNGRRRVGEVALEGAEHLVGSLLLLLLRGLRGRGGEQQRRGLLGGVRRH